MGNIILNKERVSYGIQVTMETIICYKCAIPFGVPDSYKENLINTGESFYCPNGHSQCYTEPKISVLQKKLEKSMHDAEAESRRLRDIIDRKNSSIGSITRQKSAIKGQLTKIKNRVKNGVCPCCNRTFKNLADHISLMHPEWKKL